jgi:hypothetical protein
MIGVVGTAAERARRYFNYRKPRYPVAADPDLASHRAFGVPHTAFTEEIARIATTNIDALARESGHNVPVGGGWALLDREDEIQPNEFAADLERHQAQFTGQFLIDRDGVIRWSNIEAEREGLEALDRFPSDEELIAAARAL